MAYPVEEQRQHVDSFDYIIYAPYNKTEYLPKIPIAQAATFQFLMVRAMY